MFKSTAMNAFISYAILVFLLRVASGNTTSPMKCRFYEFQCLDGKKCIPEEQKCDGLVDCEDNSDEDDSCQYFTCDNGQSVINYRYLCDGYDDCADKADESKTEANCTKFECLNGEKISSKLLCNGEDDCFDATSSDECNCQDTFTCTNDRCIANYRVCDDADDCGDGSDEELCDEFICDNGNRINKTLACNGEDDCEDSSDECSCHDSFSCGNNRCVLNSQLCDGIDDCGDTSDECGCEDTFTCDNGRCIQRNKAGNGFDDCGDNSDEKISPTTTTNQQPTIRDITTAQSLPEDEYDTSGDTYENEYDVTTPDHNEYDVTTNRMMRATSQSRDNTETTAAKRHSATTLTQDFDLDETTEQITDGVMCSNGKTVQSPQICDGIDDCMDGYSSDECDCDDTFRCLINNGDGYSKCIVSDLQCDGTDDCGDCSDELGCLVLGSEYEVYEMYQCENGSCIREELVCDGVKDCALGDDEKGCDDYDVTENPQDGVTEAPDYDVTETANYDSTTANKIGKEKATKGVKTTRQKIEKVTPKSPEIPYQKGSENNNHNDATIVMSQLTLYVAMMQIMMSLSAY